MARWILGRTNSAFVAYAIASVLLVVNLIYVRSYSGFVLARAAHSLAYLTEKQPWQTIFFILGNVATVTLIVNVGMLLLEESASH